MMTQFLIREETLLLKEMQKLRFNQKLIKIQILKILFLVMQTKYKNTKIFLKILEEGQVQKELLISHNKNYLI